MSSRATDPSYFNGGVKIGAIGIILKIIPVSVLLLEQMRVKEWYYQFAWVPSHLVNIAIAIGLLFAACGYVLGLMSIWRYFVIALSSGGSVMRPGFKLLLVGILCISIDMGYFVIRGIL